MIFSQAEQGAAVAASLPTARTQAGRWQGSVGPPSPAAPWGQGQAGTGQCSSSADLNSACPPPQQPGSGPAALFPRKI